MQLASTGRNEPCPCGSGRKYKRCCLDGRAALAADRDAGRLIDCAIDSDDWRELHEHVDRALELFAPGQPLEHIRFRDDRIADYAGDELELGKLCTSGWVRFCELEIAYALERYDLADDARAALRVTTALLRRFGASSPIVEEVAALQLRELVERRARIAKRADGVELERSMIERLRPWIAETRPAVLGFADWFALRFAPVDDFSSVWSAGVARRVCEICLARLEHPGLHDRWPWIALAALTVHGGGVSEAALLTVVSPLVDPTPAERELCDAFRASGKARFAGLADIIDATGARGDFAGCALLRHSVAKLQQLAR